VGYDLAMAKTEIENPPILTACATRKQAEKKSSSFTARLGLDTSAYDSALAELKLLLPKIPKKIRLRFLKTPAKLCCFNGGMTKGTTHTAFLKPSDLLLNLLAAARTGDFKGFVVK
jgi:hypothetical protein